MDITAEKHTCNHCGANFCHLRTLSQHIRERHTELGFVKPVQIKYNGRVPMVNHRSSYTIFNNVNKNELKSNRKDPNDIQKSTEKDTKASAVSKSSESTFKNRLQNENKYSGHMGKKAYECRHCSATFRRLSPLKNHMRIHDHVELKQTHISTRKHFPSKKRLKKTITEKATKKENVGKTYPKAKFVFQCEKCNAMFSARRYLECHMTKHEGERKQECAECGEQFSHLAEYKSHVIRVHTTHRPHKCSVCPAAFMQIVNLEKHMITHTDASYQASSRKPTTAEFFFQLREKTDMACQKCSACSSLSFKNVDDFATHMLWFHNVKVETTKEEDLDEMSYTCKECGASFVHQRTLNQHMFSHLEARNIDDYSDDFSIELNAGHIDENAKPVSTQLVTPMHQDTWTGDYDNPTSQVTICDSIKKEPSYYSDSGSYSSNYENEEENYINPPLDESKGIYCASVKEELSEHCLDQEGYTNTKNFIGSLSDEFCQPTSRTVKTEQQDGETDAEIISEWTSGETSENGFATPHIVKIWSQQGEIYKTSHNSERGKSEVLYTGIQPLNVIEAEPVIKVEPESD